MLVSILYYIYIRCHHCGSWVKGTWASSCVSNLLWVYNYKYFKSENLKKKIPSSFLTHPHGDTSKQPEQHSSFYETAISPKHLEPAADWRLEPMSPTRNPILHHSFYTGRQWKHKCMHTAITLAFTKAIPSGSSPWESLLKWTRLWLHLALEALDSAWKGQERLLLRKEIWAELEGYVGCHLAEPEGKGIPRNHGPRTAP